MAAAKASAARQAPPKPLKSSTENLSFEVNLALAEFVPRPNRADFCFHPFTRARETDDLLTHVHARTPQPVDARARAHARTPQHCVLRPTTTNGRACRWPSSKLRRRRRPSCSRRRRSTTPRRWKRPRSWPSSRRRPCRCTSSRSPLGEDISLGGSTAWGGNGSCTYPFHHRIVGGSLNVDKSVGT